MEFAQAVVSNKIRRFSKSSLRGSSAVNSADALQVIFNKISTITGRLQIKFLG